jgi:hypothetical protein
MQSTKAPVAWAIFSLFAVPFAAQASHNTPPTVYVTAPTSGATVRGTNVSCAANASDSNGIKQVQFYLDGSAWKTEFGAPYTCNFDSTKLANGSHTLRAVATDTLGATSASQVSFNISNGTTSSTNPPPTVSITAPTSGSTVGGTNVSCGANASDSNGIKQVQFYLDGSAWKTEFGSPYTCNFDSTKLANGSHTLRAVATDTLGATSSSQVSFNVSNGNTPPTVSIASPTSGATVKGTSVSCAASASDSNGIKQVQFYLDGSAILTDTTSPYACNFDSTKLANGSHTLRAVATDTLGATSSSQVSFNVSNMAPVAASDIISRASADVAFANQSGYTAQVIGTYTSAPNIPESGINGTTLPNGETLRLGKVIDPANSLSKALAFQVIGSDPTTSGGKRAELSVSPNIEMNKVYWIVFSAYVYDWGTLASTDNALFGTQMHAGDNSAGLSPSFGLYTTQYGRTFRARARYSTSSDPSQSNSVSVLFAEYPIPFGQWADFVFKFKHNTSGAGFLQVWMNGQQIANYQGSLGYNTGYKDYAKFGYYNWTASSMNGTARKVLLRSPTIVSDPTGQTYTLEQISALLGSG